MAEEKEIFRLGLDESEVAAKLAAIEARWAEVQRAMQGGGDVQAAGQAMQQEVAGLRDLAGATRGADAATQELLRNKQGFAAVLNMVGGQMGPYVGQVGQLASLLAAGGPVAVGMAGAAVGVGLLVGALRELAKASEEARAAEERRLAQAQSEKDREVQATLQMAERMQKAGFGPESVVAGQAMRESLRTRLAITGADDVIPTIIGAGVTDPDDAARLALLARSGERFGPRDAQRVLERRRGAADELLERQRAFRESDVGRLVAAGPATGAMPALTDDEIAFRRLRELGQLPPGVDSPEAMRRRLDVLERLSPALGGDPNARLRRDELTAAGFDLGAAGWWELLDVAPGGANYGAGAISEGQWEDTVRLRQARERALGPAPSTGGALPGAAIVNDNRTIHVYGGVETTREMLQMEQVQY